jgi:hypothetical protein
MRLRQAAAEVVEEEALRRVTDAVASFVFAPSRSALEELDRRLRTLRTAVLVNAKGPRPL